ncbi:signal peptidase I [Nocardioides sp.]|uniref:signal peptidase I n=1 Tax=Nocardioides sp. TaxID=35761 RepID=UPI0035B2B75F
MHTSADDVAAGPGWARLLVVLLTRAYRAMLLTLTVIAAAPLVAGWGSYVVSSASMKPSIAVGDVVLARPTTDEHKVHVGRVYVFEDPERPERLLVHRVVERRDDGDYTTAGDANDVTDLAPLGSSGVRAQAILLVPLVGLPVHWARTGDWWRLLTWLVASVAAFVIAARRLDHERPSRRRRTRVAVATAVAVGAVSAGTAGTAGAAFTARTKVSGNEWAVARWVQPYVGEVLTDKPFGFWLLDEPRGTAYAADRSGNNRTGEYLGSLVGGVAGGLPNNPGTAVDNTSGRVVLGPQPVPAPSAYSIELWFRTTSRSDSYLAGFENDRDSSWWGATADRIVRMESTGQLTFGAWAAKTGSVTTPRAYNDGAWHHLVVTSTAARASVVHVDGMPVASGTTSSVDAYTGYWRVGQGSTGFFHGLTASFEGDIDNVAIYHSTLSSARVAAHWAAR